MKFLITKISSFFLTFSSSCFAIQTLQQCKDGLFNPSLQSQVCENHADHFLFYSSPAVGLLINKKHYLYKDITPEEYSESGLQPLAQGLKVSLGSNADTLVNIDSFHKRLATISKQHWDSISRLLGHGSYNIPRIKPLQLLVSVSFADATMPGTTFSFDDQSEGLYKLQTVQLLDQATGGTECGDSPKASPPAVLLGRLKNRKLGTVLTSMKFGAGAEAYTEELECLYKDGQTRKVVLVCPYMPEQREQRKDCKPSKKPPAPSIWTRMHFGTQSYTKF